MSVIDYQKLCELKKLIESLTHSGQKELNKDELKNLFELCNNAPYLEETKTILLEMLKKNHSEIRYSSSQLCHELFMKYEAFRVHILKILDQFFSLTLGIPPDECLPPPKAAAEALKKMTLSNFFIWQKSHPLPKLLRAFKYLQKVKNVDFQCLDIVDPKKRKEEAEWETRMEKLNKERLKQITKEINDMMPDLENTLTSLESCFALLIPSVEDVDSIENSGNHPDDDMRVHGIISARHTVEIELENKIKIKVDDENGAIVDAAKDAFVLINNRYLPKIKAWVEIINKAEGGINLMREALNRKSQLQTALSKYKRLEIVREEKKSSNEDCDDEVSTDSELEEVSEPKPTSKQQTTEEISFLSSTLGLHSNNERKNKKKTHSSEQDPGPSSNSDKNERKKKLLEVAPKVTFDVDLYHWEDDKLPTPTMLAVNSEGSRFWGGAASEDLTEIPVPEGAALLRTRVIEFVGEWQPVDHVCKAPLPSGRLCPRKDRVKCPLHGLIVPRDDTGKIINEEDVAKVAKSKTKAEVPDWQDPKLLADIKAQTGIDLKMPEKGKRVKKKKYPGLTDINETKNTPTHRLAKKIFNKKSVKRVAETLDKIDHKRHRDKFGDQFNYVHGT